MLVEDKGSGRFIIIAESESAEDIACAIIIASYELAIPYGYGMMRDHTTVLTKDMAKKMLMGEDISGDYMINRNKTNDVNMDYVFGRCCKTRVKIANDKIETWISTVDRNPKAVLKRAKELL